MQNIISFKVDSEEDSRWLYECEEAMEAIDTIIDYKNEIICGRVENSSLRLFSAKNRVLIRHLKL